VDGNRDDAPARAFERGLEGAGRHRVAIMNDPKPVLSGLAFRAML